MFAKRNNPLSLCEIVPHGAHLTELFGDHFLLYFRWHLNNQIHETRAHVTLRSLARSNKSIS
jgi:hypothetical protein